MNTRRWILVTFVLVLWALPMLHLMAQNDSSAMGHLQSLIERRSEMINEWRFNARVTLGMTLAVGILGILASGLQALKWGRAKTATVFVGLGVAALTLIQGTLYTVDHRQFRRAAHRGERLLEDIQEKLGQVEHAQTDEDWATLVNEIKTRLHSIDSIQDGLLSGEATSLDTGLATASVFRLVAAAEASSPPKEPAWVTAPPREESTIYFVGLGLDRSLTAAKAAAQTDALDQAYDHFAHQAVQMGASELDSENLSQTILKSARVESTYTAFDAATQVWRYYTLLRIPRSTVRSNVEFYSIEQRSPVPQTISDQLSSAPAPTYSYYAQRKQAYDLLFASARGVVSQPAWERFEEARALRRTGDANGATALLRPLVEENNNFYLGWYNLALALDDAGDFEAATDAYRRAIALEPEQMTRDASIYNTYGYLLYRTGRYREAIEALEQAVAIAPEHPKAQRTMAAAAEALERQPPNPR